ncbi:MAG: AP2 domain-containing protein [Nanoarchaeota archaeon]
MINNKFKNATPEEKVKILELYKIGYSMFKISKIIKRSIGLISLILKKNNIHIKGVQESNRKYKFNENYFRTINLKRKAYWLGWLWGDGNVYNNIISINLQERDKYILEELKKDIKSEYKIEDYYSESPANIKYKQSRLKVSSGKMTQHLAKLNFLPCKSKLKLTPIIPKKYMPDFIRGEFEADGSICRNIKFKLQGSIRIADTEYVCVMIKKYLDMKFRKDFGYIIKYKNFSLFLISQQDDIIDFYNLIYKNCRFCLKRKRDKFKIFINEMKNRKNNKSSKYRGVCFHKITGKWYAYFKINKKLILFKLFNKEIDAALAYDKVAKDSLGSNARLNFK